MAFIRSTFFIQLAKQVASLCKELPQSKHARKYARELWESGWWITYYSLCVCVCVCVCVRACVCVQSLSFKVCLFSTQIITFQ